MAHKEPTEMRVLISAFRLSQFDYWFCLSVLTFFSHKWYLYDSCSSYLYNKLLVEIFFWTCCFVQLVLEVELWSEGPTSLWFSSDVRCSSELPVLEFAQLRIPGNRQYGPVQDLRFYSFQVQRIPQDHQTWTNPIN